MTTIFKSKKEEIFKEGMVAGAKPCEEKFQKQAEKFENYTNVFSETIKSDILPGLNTILDTMDASEKKELLGLCADSSIDNLEEDNKVVLINILHQLTREKEPSALQIQYLKSIQRYLNVPVIKVQENYDFSKIENINSISDHKALAKACTEFLFLHDCNFVFFDKYSSLFELFMIKATYLQTVKERIRSLNRLGSEFIIAQYGYINEDIFQEAETDDSSTDSVPDVLDMPNSIETCLANIHLAESRDIKSASCFFKENMRELTSTVSNCLYTMLNSCITHTTIEDIVCFLYDGSISSSVIFTYTGILFEDSQKHIIFLKYVAIDHISTEIKNLVKNEFIRFYGDFSNCTSIPVFWNGALNQYTLDIHALKTSLELLKGIHSFETLSALKRMELKLKLDMLSYYKPASFLDYLNVEQWDDRKIILNSNDYSGMMKKIYTRYTNELSESAERLTQHKTTIKLVENKIEIDITP